MTARRLALLASITMLVAVAAPVPQAAADDDPAQVVVAGPRSDAYRHAPPAVAVPQGGAITLASIDLLEHNLVHDVGADPAGGRAANDEPWCQNGPGAVPYPEGQCPVFWSKLINVFTGPTTPVLGLDDLDPGRVYPFICTIHPNMKGTLVAVPSVPSV